MCGGSILNKTAILTSAQCLSSVTSVEKLTVRVGSKQYYRGGTRYNITKYLIHPKYNASHLTYNIAILILDCKVIYSDSVQAVTLPEASDEDVEKNTEGVVSGWGIYDVQKRRLSRKLKAANMKVFLQKRCECIIKKNKPNLKTIPKSFFCLAGDKYKHSVCSVRLIFFS